MLLVLEMDVADLAATRFAISPLCETLKAVQLLARPDPPPVNRPWIRWARGQLDRRPLRLPRLWPLVVTDLPYWPEFLVPAPAGQSPGFDEELARLCATPEEPVRASLRRVFGDGRWPDSATDLFERPQESFAEIAAELAECHGRLIVPHWERIRSVLDADVAYHAGLLAGGGARSLFGDLHADLRWSAGKLFLADSGSDSGSGSGSGSGEGRAESQVTLGPDGVVLMPSVFIWPEWSVKRATSTQTTLMYPARGAATVWEADLSAAGLGDSWSGPGLGAGVSDREEAAEALLGAPRARLLGALRSPATTSALARRFGVTPSAVSQHLTVLHRGGLVDRQRRGRTVLYQTSPLGLAMLGKAELERAEPGRVELGDVGAWEARS
jgi:DNA-binding transcriptional ArsR family regulator